MKLEIYFLVLIAALAPGVSSGVFWRSISKNGGDVGKTTGKDVDDEEAVHRHLSKAAVASNTPINSRSIKSIIREQRRFVLYDSRRLSGECSKLVLCFCCWKFN